jgi:hypothetical protein
METIAYPPCSSNMIHMNPDKLAKIRAIAMDPRGNPATRAVAQKMLEEHAPPPPPLRQPPNPRMRHSAEYDRWKFMDLEKWKKTVNGNLTYLLNNHRVILFQRSKTWGALIINLTDDSRFFSSRYATLSEAHRASWDHLQKL